MLRDVCAGASLSTGVCGAVGAALDHRVGVVLIVISLACFIAYAMIDALRTKR